MQWRRGRAWALRLRGVFADASRDRLLAEELESHLQLHIDDDIRRGVSPDEARRRAVLALGGVEPVKEAYRDRRGLPMLDSLQRDVRYGFRTLRKSPGFSAAAILILAVGIGANAAMFSVVNAVALRPLGFPDADRILRVWHVPPPTLFPGVTRFSVSPANYLDWRAQNDVFSRMAIYGGRQVNLTGRGEPDAISGAAVSLDYFPVLGINAAIGRFFQAGEDEPGRDNVVVLGDALWRTRFGGDPGTVGQSIMVDGVPRTVVGVAPRLMNAATQARLWVPLAWTPAEREVRGNHNYLVVARLKPGVTVARAQAEMTTISDRLAKLYPVDDTGWGALVLPLQQDIVGNTATSLFVLLGAVGFVVLIACANLANLLLAKTLGRSKEIAVRTALGASRGRVVQQMLCETALLGLLGGASGLLLARVSLSTIVSLLHDVPRAGEIDVDWRVLAFTALVAALTGVAAGVAPAWRLVRTDVHDALKQGLSRSGGQAGDRRMRHTLVVAEVALALVLLVGAGLLIRTLAALRAVDPGINPHGVLTMTVGLPRAKYPEPADQARFFQQALDRIRALPAIHSASAIDSLPFQGGSMQPISIEGQPVKAMSEQPEVAVRGVMPDYMRTIGTRLIAGRDITRDDTADRPPVVLVSQALARHFWPGGSPLGRHLTLTFQPKKAWEVVGIVADAKLNGLDQAMADDAVYVPMLQDTPPGLSLVVRTSLPPQSVASAVTQAIHGIDPDQPVIDVLTMDDVVDTSLAQQRFAMELLAAFAALALLLAAIGIYSVLSYTVRQRFREIGIRMALGAPPSGVLRMVVVEGMKPTLIGVGVGLVAAFALGRVLSTLVYGVSARDRATFVVVSVLVALVGSISSLLPAYRATRVDPLIALRDE
jgi:putative ABC transport system permease protein